jgi:universal stress protein A
MKRILVGIDFSPEAEAAARTALTFARAFDATVTLLHVHDLPAMLNTIVPGADNRADAASLKVAAAEQLDAFRARLDERDPRAIEGSVSIETVVEGGVPAEVILRRADEDDFDLIVVGTHGLTGLRRLLVGSVAEAVIRGAHCPVVTVRLPVRELR